MKSDIYVAAFDDVRMHTKVIDVRQHKRYCRKEELKLSGCLQFMLY